MDLRREGDCATQQTGHNLIYRVTLTLLGGRLPLEGKCRSPPLDEQIAKHTYDACVPQRNGRVSVADLLGVEHTVEVTAGSVYESVAAALAVFARRRMGWPDWNWPDDGQC